MFPFYLYSSLSVYFTSLIDEMAKNVRKRLAKKTKFHAAAQISMTTLKQLSQHGCQNRVF